MSTNRFLFLLTAGILSGLFTAFSAMAQTQRPAPYQQLTAVAIAPGQAPELQSGFQQLSGAERSHRERLPVQLTGAMRKIEKTKYKPSRPTSPRSKSIRF